MKSWLAVVLSVSCASVAFAEPPQQAASALIDKLLVAPLKKAESRRSKFSREAPVAVQRRIRMLDAELLTDVQGKRFVRFAIDVRRPHDEDEQWHPYVVLGCAYPEDKQVFVRSGEEFVPASSLLGKDVEPSQSACRAAQVVG
jgi:hypothetical protein